MWTVNEFKPIELNEKLKRLERFFEVFYNWHKNSFAIYAEVFSDGGIVYKLDPPTNLSKEEIEQAEEKLRLLVE